MELHLKKEIWLRLWGGFCSATVIGLAVNLLVSLIENEGDGRYLPVMPQLARHFETELAAVAIQYLIIGLIGVTLAEAALVFFVEKWSFLKQCLMHFLLSAPFYLPFAILCWQPLKLWSLLCLLFNILLTYTITFVVSYRKISRDAESINQKIQEVRRLERH